MKNIAHLHMQAISALSLAAAEYLHINAAAASFPCEDLDAITSRGAANIFTINRGGASIPLHGAQSFPAANSFPDDDGENINLRPRAKSIPTINAGNIFTAAKAHTASTKPTLLPARPTNSNYPRFTPRLD